MRTFAIRDDEDHISKDYGYLIYYEIGKRFYIELPDDADPWETPLILSSLLKKGQKTINSYWSHLWVQQRIVPNDRQNLGQILRDNGLDEYDEFKLLMLANGRCAQDSFYLSEIDFESLQEKFKERYEIRIDDVIPMENNCLLVFFKNGAVKKCDVATAVGENRFFSHVLSRPEIFKRVSVQVGGYGVLWGDYTEIEDSLLYKIGVDVPLSMADFESFLKSRIVNTAEAAEILNCSKQNINDLVHRGKLKPIRTELNNRYFLRTDVSKRLWK